MNTSLIYFVLAMAGGVFTVNLQNGMVIQSRQLWGIVQVLSIDLGKMANGMLSGFAGCLILE